MRQQRVFVPLYSMIAVCLTITACQTFPDGTSEKSKQAFYANQVLVRVGELQNATIAAHAAGSVPDASAIAIVKFTVSAAQTVRDVPNGWLLSVSSAYEATKAQLSAEVKTRLALLFTAIDTLIAAVKGSDL